MLSFSPEKLLLVGMIALIVLGPDRLPAAARSFGRLMGKLRRTAGSLQNEMNQALAEPRHAFDQAAEEFGLGELKRVGHTVRDSLTGPFTASPRPAPGPLEPPAGGAILDEPTPDDPSFN